MLAPALLVAALVAATPEQDRLAAVNAVLDDWHRAAAAADEPRYFGHFTADAVFLGTDGTERWTRDEFRTWSHPYFARGKAWSFTPRNRRVTFSPDGTVAWFDEALDTANMGPCRGSGVLVREGDAWRIAQYNLSVPIPNALVKDFVARIAKHAGAQQKAPARTK
ncbi:MAG: nuclear transport factor 2 family protein [Myxococcaceae bacterium]|nr:nuclear transport factor 2 family protein [Myxococcaceae bacterium]MCI0671227.1 nuclear transport factor 2 family protein [Myxococcaceae bacterium]